MTDFLLKFANAAPPKPLQRKTNTAYEKVKASPPGNKRFFISVATSRPGDSGSPIVDKTGAIIGFVEAGDMAFNVLFTTLTEAERLKITNFTEELSP